MADVKESLSKKVGPLPMVAWVGLVAGAYVVYRYYKASRQAAAPIASGQPVVSAGGDIGNAADMSSGWGGAGGTAVGSSTPTPSQFTPATNQDWLTAATNAGIAMGFNPIDVETALGSYVYGTGQQLNSTQTGILAWALQKVGGPPTAVIPPPTTPPPSSQQPAPSATPLPPNPSPVISPNEATYNLWQRGRENLSADLNPFAGWGPYQTLNPQQQRQVAAYFNSPYN